jgi:putative flippase GtrA
MSKSFNDAEELCKITEQPIRTKAMQESAPRPDVNHGLRAEGNLSSRTAWGFLLVGASATALHHALTLLFAVGLGFPVVASSTIGFIVSAAFNYLLNAYLTFRSALPHTRTLPRFVATATTGLLLNAALLAVLLAMNLHPVLAQMLSTLVVLTWNYCASALWTFKNPTS